MDFTTRLKPWLIEYVLVPKPHSRPQLIPVQRAFCTSQRMVIVEESSFHSERRLSCPLYIFQKKQYHRSLLTYVNHAQQLSQGTGSPNPRWTNTRQLYRLNIGLLRCCGHKVFVLKGRNVIFVLVNIHLPFLLLIRSAGQREPISVTICVACCSITVNHTRLD